MEIREVDETFALCLRETTPIEKISEVMGRSYDEIAAFMGRRGIAFSGPPYALYRNMDMSALDIEMGVPVKTAAEGEGRITASALPAGKIAATLYIGPYAGIGTAYEKLKAFVEEKGLESEDWSYEFYLNSPEDTPEEELQTEICFPLKS